MAFILLIVKSAFRNRLRTLLTSAGVAIAIVAFLFLRTFVAAWYAGVESAASDRMIVRNKISITFSLPLSYIDKIKNVPGVSGVSYENWFGGVYLDERNFFAKFAADDAVFPLYPEIQIPPDQWKDYVEDRTGAIVGEHLIEKYHWKIGDKITIQGDIYPGNWDFTIRGVYTAKTNNIDKSTMFFHWKYLNEKLEERRKDQVGIVVIKVAEAGRSNEVSSGIDKMFLNSIAETRTESEKAFQLEFVSMGSAVVGAIQVVSFVVLLILVLILGNTLAMASRERTTEYAVMRAIGFKPWHVVRLVLGEGFVIAAVGVIIGVAAATPIMHFFADMLEKAMGGFITGFDLRPSTVGLAVGVALVGGMLAAALPAYRAGRLKIVDALRRIE